MGESDFIRELLVNDEAVKKKDKWHLGLHLLLAFY